MVENWKNSQMPLYARKAKWLQHRHTMGCQEAFKTNEVDLYELTWKDLQGILIGKKKLQKDTYNIILT